MTDRVSAFPPDALARLDELLAEAHGLLAEHGVTLTAGERSRLYKMGDKSEAFVEKTVRYTGEHPELVPGFLDAAELASDLGAARALEGVAQRAAQLEALARDTATVAGSEAQTAALVFYRAVRAAARVGAPAAETVYADLRERFERPAGARPDAE